MTKASQDNQTALGFVQGLHWRNVPKYDKTSDAVNWTIPSSNTYSAPAGSIHAKEMTCY